MDSAWWATTIRRASVVDVDFARQQFGNPELTERGAVRAYVRDGFRLGVSLNPLFLEGLVSSQLPDSDRVPALYAYLVADTSRIETTVAWSAAEHASQHPESIAAPGGPLGHAWRMLRRGSRLPLRHSASTFDESGLRSAVVAAVASSGSALHDVTDPSAIVLTLVLDDRDDDGGALIAAADFAATTSTTTVIDTRAATNRVKAASGLLALADPRVVLRAATADARYPAEVVVIRRDAGAIVSADLFRALALEAGLGPVAPLWLASDGTVASAGVIAHGGQGFPLLSGFPREDAVALGSHIPSAGLMSPVRASRIRDDATPRTLSSHTTVSGATPGIVGLPGAPDSPFPALARGLALDRWSGRGPVLIRRTTTMSLAEDRVVPRLRWGIKTAAPAGAEGESWGDTHFARGLAAALERLGQFAAVDARAAARRSSSELDDVSLVLRGPHPIDPPETPSRLLWIISHPDEVTEDELGRFDTILAASTQWANDASARFRRPITPLLQCTDSTRFRPSQIPRDSDIVFVGTARGIARPSVIAPIRAGIPLRVYGPDWRGYIPASHIASTHIPNHLLPARYESAAVVLNDHWPEMQRNGFISNRIFDVVAAGGRVISDNVDGIEELFDGAVVTYRDPEELVGLLHRDLDTLFPSQPHLAHVSSLVRERDSFDARARTLLELVLASRGDGGRS